MYRGQVMLASILKTAAIVCHMLCLLHVSTALHLKQRNLHLNDTALAHAGPSSSYQTHDDSITNPIRYYMTHACEREQLHISCDRDHVILIVRANYGRHSTRPCAKTTKKRHTVLCPGSFVHPKKVLVRACTGSRSCRVSVLSRLFGDPCPKVSKYLEVYFGCIREQTNTDGDYS